MFSRRFVVAGLLLFGLNLQVGATAENADVPPAPLGDLPNVRYPEAHRIVSGAIDAAAVAKLRAAGVRHVINLRTPAESPGFDESRAVTEQGLAYHALPIAGRESLTMENARRLDDLLKQIGAESVLIHCASGNRVGALVAVREAWIKGRSPDEAIAEGKRWGLTKLEDTVRAVLSE